MNQSRAMKVGQAPGSLIYIGQKRNDQARMRLIRYTAESVQEKENLLISDLAACKNDDAVNWIDVDGIHDSSLIEQIGEQFGIHALLLEDIMNSTTRPKVEFGEDYLFITLKSIESEGDSKGIRMEQFSMILGRNYLITFQEQTGDPFDPIRERIRTGKGVVRQRNAQYLAYLMLDTIVDHYISVSAKYADAIDALESQVLRGPSELTLHRILHLRKDLLSFKRSIDPLREIASVLQKEVDKRISKYYRDLTDHILAEIDNLVVYREMLVTLLDLYHSSLSYRMNSVIKVLTIITTIFVPLTFIVGIYGMNFHHMPELEWENGYFYVLGFMAALVIMMLYFFRRRRWI